MVAGAFPLAKLAYMGMRQISKPVATGIKNGAKRSHVFRRFVCLPTAQFYHWAETTIKMQILGLGKPLSVAPLNEQMAVELGADILGEVVVFGFAAVLTVMEYNRSAAKAQAKEDELYQRLATVEDNLQESCIKLENQHTQIRELQRQLAQANASPLDKFKRKIISENVQNDTPLQRTVKYNSELDQKENKD